MCVLGDVRLASSILLPLMRMAQSSTGASSSFFSAWVSVESLTFREVGGSKETLAATNWGCFFIVDVVCDCVGLQICTLLLFTTQIFFSL